MFEALQESAPLKVVVVLIGVVALIGIVFWALRRFGGDRFGNSATRGRQPRLGVVDKVELGDGRRRLVIIRRDNVEHLVMIGGPTDVVVEQNIVRAMGAPRDKSIEPTLGRGLSETTARTTPVGEGNMFPLQPAPETNGRAGRAFPEEPVQWTWPAHAEQQRPATPEPTRAPRAEARPEPKIEPKVEPRLDPMSGFAEEVSARPAKRENNIGRTATPPMTRPAPVAAPAPAEQAEATEMPSMAETPDQHLAEMANRLEASLRHANEPRLPEPPAPPKADPMVPPMVPPTARMTAPEPRITPLEPRATAPEPRITPLEPKPARAETKPAAPEVKPPKALFDSLEEEMASLLGRPPGKP